MREESHLDEMRDAIRGDFERLAERRGEQDLMRAADPGETPATASDATPETEPDAPEQEPGPEPAPESESDPAPEPDSLEPAVVEHRSWLARLFSS